MTTLRTLLIDDIPLHTERLERVIKHECPKTIQIIGRCHTVKEALAAIKTERPDLIFLDVELDEGQEAFELLAQVPLIDFDVIFCTAHMEYAFRAFRADAVDYLLKPVDSTQLIKAVNKVLARSPRERIEFHQHLIEASSSEVRRVSRIGIPNQLGRLFIEVADIYYCQANEGGTDFLGPKNKHLGWTSESLTSIVKALQKSNFYQIYKSYIVNLAHVKSYRSNKRGGIVTLRDGTELPVSVEFKGGFLDETEGGIE